MKIFWTILGWLALALAAAGVVLPLMPTVPFVLVAAYAFARSSERIHRKLLNHPTFGPAIIAWRDRGAINYRAKWWASLSFFGSIGLALFLGLPIWVLAAQATALAACAAFIWSRPNA